MPCTLKANLSALTPPLDGRSNQALQALAVPCGVAAGQALREAITGEHEGARRAEQASAARKCSAETDLAETKRQRNDLPPASFMVGGANVAAFGVAFCAEVVQNAAALPFLNNLSDPNSSQAWAISIAPAVVP